MHYGDYRDIDPEEEVKSVNDNLSKLTINNKVKKLDLNELGWVFDAASLYTNAMWDKSWVHPKTECGFAFKPHKKVIFVKSSKIKLLTEVMIKVQF